jgi:hypothetical protein
MEDYNKKFGYIINKTNMLINGANKDNLIAVEPFNSNKLKYQFQPINITNGYLKIPYKIVDDGKSETIKVYLSADQKNDFNEAKQAIGWVMKAIEKGRKDRHPQINETEMLNEDMFSFKDFGEWLSRLTGGMLSPSEGEEVMRTTYKRNRNDFTKDVKKTFDIDVDDNGNGWFSRKKPTEDRYSKRSGSSWGRYEGD